MPKKTERGTLWDFSTSILSQNSKKIEGGPFGEKFYEKCLAVPKKIEKGDPLVSPGMVCYTSFKLVRKIMCNYPIIVLSMSIFLKQNCIQKLIGLKSWLKPWVNNFGYSENRGSTLTSATVLEKKLEF